MFLMNWVPQGSTSQSLSTVNLIQNCFPSYKPALCWGFINYLHTQEVNETNQVISTSAPPVKMIKLLFSPSNCQNLLLYSCQSIKMKSTLTSNW